MPIQRTLHENPSCVLRGGQGRRCHKEAEHRPALGVRVQVSVVEPVAGLRAVADEGREIGRHRMIGKP